MENREIDRLIAEKVLGYKSEQITQADSVLRKGKKISDGEWRLDLDGSGFVRRIIMLPHYSTNIKDAWLVARKFEYHRIEMDAGHYYCTLSNGSFFDGDGETAPMAICLAALKAVGVPEEN